MLNEGEGKSRASHTGYMVDGSIVKIPPAGLPLLADNANENHN